MMNKPEYWSAKADRHHAERDRLIQERDRADAEQDNDLCRAIDEKIEAEEAAIWHSEEMFDLATRKG